MSETADDSQRIGFEAARAAEPLIATAKSAIYEGTERIWEGESPPSVGLAINLLSPDFYDTEGGRITNVEVARLAADRVLEALRSDYGADNTEGRQEDTTERDLTGHEVAIVRWTSGPITRQDKTRPSLLLHVKETHLIDDSYPADNLGITATASFSMLSQRAPDREPSPKRSPIRRSQFPGHRRRHNK